MNTHAVLLIAVSALVTALIRFAPFLVFRGGRETPAVILRLDKLLPCAVMSMWCTACGIWILRLQATLCRRSSPRRSS